MTAINDARSRSCEIRPADLQLLLCAKFGPRLRLLESSSSSLLPPGENFACEIFKIRALVKRDEDSPSEELHLVGKAFPLDNASVRQIFDFGQLFRKEVFFYESIEPVLRDLALEFGEEAFEVAPRCFGSRMPKDSGDEGVVILMENLKRAGYYSPDKLEGAIFFVRIMRKLCTFYEDNGKYFMSDENDLNFFIS